MAHSDSEAESVASQESDISFSQQFEPQEDDEELLWEVEKITAEKKNQYKVKWKGIDPKTRKPWDQSWVAKKDCTPDLVIAWKAEKKEKERRKSTASKGRASTDSRKDFPYVAVSRASTSKLPEASGSTASKLRRGRSSTASARAATTVSPVKSSKVVESIPEDSSEAEEETRTQSTSKAKGKKRKLAEANSTHNSANVAVDVNVNKAGDAVEHRPAAGRASKKRKIEIETVKQEPTEIDHIDPRQSSQPPQATQDEESQEDRKPRGKSALFRNEEQDEDEEDARMVEDELSQGYNTTPEVDELDEEVPNKPTLNKGKGRVIEVDSENEEWNEGSVIVVSPKPSKNPPKKSTTTNGTSKNKSSTMTKSTKSTEPSAKAKSTKKSKVDVIPESKPPSPPPKIGPPPQKSSSNVMTKGKGMKDVTVRPLNRRVMQTSPTQPRRSSIHSAKSKSSAHTNSNSDSDSDTEPPVLVRTGSGSQNRSIPIEEPSAVWQGDSEVSVSLTEADLDRLRVFDEEVMNVPVSDPLVIDSVSSSEAESLRYPPPSPQLALKSQADVRRKMEKDEEQNEETDEDKHIVEKAAPQPAVRTAPKDQRQPQRALKSTTPRHSVAAAEPKPNGTYRQRSANDHDEVIPETEEEESQSQTQSQSQSQSQSLHPHLDIPVPATPPAPSYPYLQPPSTPGGRSTVRSRMKPRTPLSRASSMASAGGKDRERDNEAEKERERPLRPIPEMSPSVFYPHLPEPTSSLPESIVDASGSSDNRRNGGEDDAHMSSIEEFDSPDKSRAQQRTRGVVLSKTAAGKGKGKEKQKESAEDIWESDVVKRGQEIAEVAKRKTEAERNEQQRPKKTLDEIRATRNRSASNVSQLSSTQSETGKGKKEKGKGKVKEKVMELIHEKIVEEDEEMQDVSTSVVPPASGPRDMNTQSDPHPHPELGSESLTLEEMEEAYVDLDGGVATDGRPEGSGSNDIMALREEEEESTQDLMMDIVPQRRIEDIDVDSGWNTRPQEPQIALAPAATAATHKLLDTIAENEGNGTELNGQRGEVREIPEIVIQDSEPSHPRTSTAQDPNVGLMRTTRSRSRSQTPLPQNAREKSKSVSKKTSKAGSSRQTSLAPPDAPGQSHNDLLDRLNAAVALNESRWSDITRLQAELAAEKLKTSEIQAKAESNLQAMQEAVNLITTEHTTEKEALEQMVKDSDAKHHDLLAEKVEWEAERARLVAELESARQGKASADKDREFFREQYAQASGYVTQVRDENKDLEKRIKIAEGQAQDGVALVKKTFEERVKTLQNESKSWQKMALFLVEKDRRTDNDDLRRRASEQPELAMRCLRQEQHLDAMDDKVEELELQLEQRNKDWMTSREEAQKWKNELMQVHVALTEATTKLERLGRAGGGHGGDPNANEFVYCCQWRIGYEEGGESRACHEVFPTMSGFEEHITNIHLGP